jgi:hypothetical protein
LFSAPDDDLLDMRREHLVEPARESSSSRQMWRDLGIVSMTETRALALGLE